MNFSRIGSSGDGPEYVLERSLLDSIELLFDDVDLCWWGATSFPIGASRPDILFVGYAPQVRFLAESAPIHLNVISYLFGVSRAKPETISSRINRPVSEVNDAIDLLVELDITRKITFSYSLDPAWRRVLSRVVSIEVKVKNWRGAIQQAKLNLSFSHEVYVAFPERLASRVFDCSELRSTPIGVISIDDQEISVIRKAKHSMPLVPSYYFKIAAEIAKSH